MNNGGSTYVDNGPAIAFMVIMIVIIIFLVLALTVPMGNGRKDYCVSGSGKNKYVNAAPAVRMQGDGFLEASGLGQNFQKFESGQVDGRKLGFNRPLTAVQDSHGHDFPILMNISKVDFEIQKQGMKPTRNQIFVNRIDMNPGDCGNGVPNDIYMSALFGEDDDSVLLSGRSSRPASSDPSSMIALVTDVAMAENILDKANDGIVIVASHGCGACRGLMNDLHQAASSDENVRNKLTSGKVHFIEASTFHKTRNHSRFGKVDGIPTTFHMKNGKVHKKHVGKRSVREILDM